MIEKETEALNFYHNIDNFEINGYKVADLTDKDREFIKGMAWAKMLVQDDCGQYWTDEGRVLESLLSELEDETKDYMAQVITGGITEMLFYMIDGYEEEGR